ncbi:Cep120 protein-domain-containing protein [Gorgonomyces haynaldii]|nr:Cep120 protein-domain-containing protein [Gorgonomyces haynaldii]
MKVFSVIRGRNFNKKPDSKLYVQCRFNNEILVSDPVEHKPSPVWDTELAWDVQPKTLSFLRSQRASLKLVCYALDIHNEREPLGYVMLDLRAAVQGSGPYAEKWYPLVNTHNTTAFRPELKMTFAVTNPRDTLTSIKKREKIEIILHKDGYYQIGIDRDTKFYTWWITIAFAEHLTHLGQHETKDGFYFYYSLFGNDIVTQKFKDLNDPNFPAERVSLRLKSSERMLRQALNELKTLVIHLCKDDLVLGVAHVPLSQLVVSAEVSVMEQVYPLQGTDQKPTGAAIGVSMALGLEKDAQSEKPVLQEVHTHTQSVQPSQSVQQSSPVQHSQPVQQSHSVQQTVQSVQQTVETVKTVETVEIVDKQDPLPRVEPPQPTQEPERVEKPMIDTHRQLHSPTRDSAWHQFRFSIELRSVMDCQIKSAHVYFKYMYTPFGTSSPFITHPGTNITRVQKETLLPHSFCAFEFVMDPKQLETYLQGVPLLIEMWHKDDNMRDIHIGNCSVDLSLVLRQPHTNSEQDIVLQSFDSCFPVIAVGMAAEKRTRLIDLRVIMALEDFGAIEEYDQVLPESIKPQTVPSRNQPEPLNQWKQELWEQERWKLEQWKQEEQEKFLLQLAEKEQLLNAQLAHEWRQREQEREKVLKKKLADYKSLESQLEKLSVQLETKEKSLIEAELLLETRKRNLEQETTRSLNEARDATRRIAEEFKYKMELEKSRTSEAELQKNKLLREKETLEEHYKALDLEFATFRRNQTNPNESALQLELAKALAQNASLVQELEQTKTKLKQTKSKLQKVHKGYLELKAASTRQQALERDNVSRFQQLQQELGKAREAKEQVLQLKHDLVNLETPEKENVNPSPEKDRLQRERASLLSSKVYDENSPLIRDLDRAISEIKT